MTDTRHEPIVRTTVRLAAATVLFFAVFVVPPTLIALLTGSPA